MKKELGIKIGLAIMFVGLCICLTPQYIRQIPRTNTQISQSALAEISHILPQAPIALITEPDNGIDTVLTAITQAQKSIHLVIYELSDQQIEQALVDAKNRGVLVKVILQNVHTFGKNPNQPAYDFLTSNGVPIIWASSYFMLTHQKTLITDGNQAIIMTFNLVPKYYASGRDFGIVDIDPVDVKAIQSTFDNDFAGLQIPADNGTDLVWSPNAQATLLGIINSAKTSLDIYNEEMADTDIILALKQAAERNVKIRITMTYATNWKKAFNDLTQAGATIKTYASSAKFYIHAKMILADNTEAFLGSQNFSYTSLHLNRELGILITRPDIISSLENTFNTDFANARVYSIK